MDVVGGQIDARDSLAAEVNVLRREIACAVSFGQDVAVAQPVTLQRRSGAAVGLQHALAIRVIGIGGAIRALNAVFRVIDVKTGVAQVSGGIVGEAKGTVRAIPDL